MKCVGHCLSAILLPSNCFLQLEVDVNTVAVALLMAAKLKLKPQVCYDWFVLSVKTQKSLQGCT